MNIILINLFIAIIDKSYNKIKEKIKNLTTNYDFKRVFFFCCFRQEKKYESKTVTIEKEFEYELKPEVIIFNLIYNNNNLINFVD